MPTLAEDLLNLLLDDGTGTRLLGRTRLDYALTCALLLELVADNRVRLRPVTPASDAPFATRGTPATGDDVLDRAWQVLAATPLRRGALVKAVSGAAREAVFAALVRRGAIRPVRSRVLGVLPRTRWPAVSNTRKRKVTGRLTAALRRDGEPDDRTVDLINVLHAADALHKVVDGGRAALRNRAEEIVRRAADGPLTKRSGARIDVFAVLSTP